jgi:hypothetical protein
LEITAVAVPAVKGNQMSTAISKEDLEALAKALKEAKPEIKSEDTFRDACKGIMSRQATKKEPQDVT